jgi:cell division septation protein DedD
MAAALRTETVNADSAVAETPDPGTTLFAVQVAAVRTASAADAAMQSLRAQGHAPRVFREDGLFKVRVGRFTNRRDADNLARQLRRLLGDGPFVVEESQ